MVLLQKKIVIDILREQLVWHIQRQASAGEDNLDEPDFKKQRSGPADHRMNSDLGEDDAGEDDESTRNDGVRIYLFMDNVLERFWRGQFLSGFMIPHGPDGLVLVPYSISLSMADCVLFPLQHTGNETE